MHNRKTNQFFLSNPCRRRCHQPLLPQTSYLLIHRDVFRSRNLPPIETEKSEVNAQHIRPTSGTNLIAHRYRTYSYSLWQFISDGFTPVTGIH